MKQMIKRTFIVGAALTLLLSPAVVSARDGSTTVQAEEVPTASTSPSPSPSETPKPARVQQFEDQLKAQLLQMKQQRQADVETVKADLNEKLAGAKQKACENHQTTINRLMSVMDTRRQKTFDRITQVTTAVEAFYTKNKLSVSNYTDLVATVDAAKAVAQTAMASQKAIPELDCSGDHPRADVTDFKQKRADSIDAMKAYRDAVKALVQAVKTAADTAKGDS